MLLIYMSRINTLVVRTLVVCIEILRLLLCSWCISRYRVWIVPDSYQLNSKKPFCQWVKIGESS